MCCFLLDYGFVEKMVIRQFCGGQKVYFKELDAVLKKLEIIEMGGEPFAIHK
jgi:hypothetical protein